MFEKTIIRSTQEGVTRVEAVSEDTIAYTTLSNELKLLNIETLKTSTVIRTAKKEKSIIFAFSQDKRKLAYIDHDTLVVVDTLLQNRSRQVVAKVFNRVRLPSEATLLSFDASGRYVFVGMLDNTVLQYTYNSNFLLATYTLFETFKKRTKGITAIAFRDATMIVSGNRGDLSQVNIYTKITQKIFVNASTTINDIQFIDDTYVLTAHENGDSRIVNINALNDYKKFDIPLTKIKQMLFLDNREYMLVCGNEEYISLVNVKTQKNIRTNYLSFEYEVQSMVLVSSFVLVVVLVDNSIVRVNLATPQQLESLILHGAFDQAYELVRKEPQLLHSAAYRKLEATYENILNRVAEEIPSGNKEFALQTVDFFKDIHVKKKEIQLVLEAFDRYEQFQGLVIQRDYIPAYSLVERYPILKKTKEFRVMEAKFKEQMAQAQELLIHGNKEGAYVQLSTYIRVKSKNSIVKLFLNHGESFLPYLDLLKKKDVEGLQEAIRQDKHFAKYVNSLGIDLNVRDIRAEKRVFIENLIDNEDFDAAQEAVEEMQEYLSEKIVEHLSRRLEDAKKLYVLYEKKEFAECFNFIDTHESVQNAKITLLLEAYWKKLIMKTEIFCINNDIQNVKKILQKYKNLTHRKAKLDELTQCVLHKEKDIQVQEKEKKYHEKILNHSFVKKLKGFKS